jgi:hypothetical protein
MKSGPAACNSVTAQSNRVREDSKMPNKRLYQFLLNAVTAHLNSDYADDCLAWPHYCMKNGYGQTCVNGKHELVHRVSFKHFIEDPGALEVLHSCDNPPCFNPLHLFKGTQADNLEDMWSKSRGKNPVHYGIRNVNNRLTPDDIRQIRLFYTPSIAGGGGTKLNSLPYLAQKFGVSVHTVWNIVKRTTWTHIE